MRRPKPYVDLYEHFSRYRRGIA